MRYTTIIDMTELATLYRNQNARLVYMHLVLKSGYHDHDRDLYDCSIRRLAMDIGLSLGAVRHALKLLEKHKLIERQSNLWYVRKFVASQAITPRAKTERQQKRIEQLAEARRQQEQRELQLEVERQQRERNWSQGKTNYMIYYEQQLKLAAAGDENAQRIVRQGEATYKAHQESMRQQNNQKGKP